MLKRNIHIITSWEKVKTDRERITKIEYDDNLKGSPILLGQIGDKHYVSVGKYQVLFPHILI